MMKFQLTIASAIIAGSCAYSVPSLTPDNYDSLTEGKTVFIKFFAPWCGHCKKMAPDWERLSEEWDSNTVGLVAEVDCTGDGKPLCDENGVRGFPTLKYGEPSNLENYEGSRSYEDLKSFASENLKPVCSISKLELCDEEKKKLLNSYMELSPEDLDAIIVKEEEKLKEVETAFTDAVARLQAEYQKLTEEKELASAAIKDSGLGLMKSVLVKQRMDATDEL